MLYPSLQKTAFNIVTTSALKVALNSHHSLLILFCDEVVLRLLQSCRSQSWCHTSFPYLELKSSLVNISVKTHWRSSLVVSVSGEVHTITQMCRNSARTPRRCMSSIPFAGGLLKAIVEGTGSL